jgi:hypothetical protein
MKMPGAITLPNGKLLPGWRNGDVFTDFDDNEWLLAEDGTWTPPASYLEGTVDGG